MCSKYFHGSEARRRLILLMRMLALPHTGSDVVELCGRTSSDRREGPRSSSGKTVTPCVVIGGTVEIAMTGIDDHAAMRVSDADRNGTLRRLHNAVALGLIDIDEFEERSALVSSARLHTDLDNLVGDLPGPGAIVTTAADRVELRGVFGSLKRQGEWIVPTRLAPGRRGG